MRFVLVVVIALCCIDQSLQQLEDAAYWETVASAELQRALYTTPNTKRARNVILFVGDGMGLNTNTAARIYKGQLRNEGVKAERGRLIFEEFPHLGLLKTYNVDKQVPDSASTATALFCGAKANHKTVGVDANVKLDDCEASLNTTFHLKSIIQWAQDSGMRTGFVTNTRVTHATPSALYAHSPQRSWECEAKMPQSASKCKDIARQLVEDEPGKSINVIFGGGRQCMVSNVTGTTSDPIDKWACYRSDGRNMINVWQTQKANENAKYAVVSNQKELKQLKTKSLDYVLGVFSNGFMKYEYDRDYTVDPSLADMTIAAIDILDKGENGFLLVVESGLIDQAHHRGTAKLALHETAVVLENAVQAALKKVNVYEDALVIVTADHSHSLSISGYPLRGNDIFGIADKSKIDSLNYTTLTYATGTEIKYFAVNATHISRKDPSDEYLADFRYQQQSTIATEEAVHGGGDVAVYAKGPWAHLFHTLHEQNYVAHVIGHAAKIGPYKSHGSDLSFSLALLLVLVLICELV